MDSNASDLREDHIAFTSCGPGTLSVQGRPATKRLTKSLERTTGSDERLFRIRGSLGAARGRSVPAFGRTMNNLDEPILFLATANAERSRAFYERVLGLAFVADEPFALVFQTGHSMLRIQKVDQVHNAAYTALGWAVSDIRGTIRNLCEAGVTFQRYKGM